MSKQLTATIRVRKFRRFYEEMLSGRRPGKRSIVGTRVCAPYTGGFYWPGVISAIQTAAPWEATGDRYTVEFEDGSKRTFDGDDIVGAGFQSVTKDRLNSGQTVFITHNGREVEGSVESIEGDEVAVTLSDNSCRLVVSVRLDDIRLLKSRRSARLSESQPDPISVLNGDSPFESSYKRSRPTEVASVSRSWPYNRWYESSLYYKGVTKTDITPAILWRDFVAQLYCATKLQYAMVHVAHCNFVA